MEQLVQLKGRHEDKYAIVDADDFLSVIKHNWYYRNDGYVATNIGRKTIYLHRFIANTPSGFSTDHINRDKLDNRKSNLKICTHAENMQNTGRSGRGCVKKLHSNGSTYYIGEIRINKKRYITTTCENSEQAKGALKQMIKDKNL